MKQSSISSFVSQCAQSSIAFANTELHKAISDLVLYRKIKRTSLPHISDCPQTAFNLIEAAVASLIADGLDEETAQSIIPNRSFKTAETYAFQQFSTPPLIAKQLFEWLDTDKQPTSLLEPSAGTGMLIAQALKKVPTLSITANDIDKKRLDALSFFFGNTLSYTTLNAEFMSMLTKKRYDVVAMNPPFSASTRTTENSFKNAIIHLDQAVQCLNPSGQLLAVLPQAAVIGRWIDLKQKQGFSIQYQCVDGTQFKKMGAKFPFILLSAINPKS
jgi:predicted RNA methylase